MLRPNCGYALANAGRPHLASAHAPRLPARTRRSPPRAARITSPDSRDNAIPSAAAATDTVGPPALDLALACLAWMAVGARHRQTRDGHRLAPPELSAVLEVEEPSSSGRPTVSLDVRTL